MRSGRPARWSWRSIDAATAVALVAVVVDVYQWVLARPLWLDEEMIAINIRDRGLADLNGPLWLAQSAPHGWLVLQRAAALMLGASDRTLRAIPLLFGIGFILAALVIGRRWLTPAAAAVLVLLCAFSTWTSYYVLELKQYSGDMLWGLVLPGLAAWAVSPRPEDVGRYRRVTLWWMVASVAQWLSNGALLATPACTFALIGTGVRQDGWRGLWRAASPAVIFVAAFAIHYRLSMRHTLASDYLNAFWSFALPPAGAGVTGTAAWLGQQLVPFALKPGGTALGALFWCSFVCGTAWLVGTRAALGLPFALIPVSALMFAAFRFAPLYERLSLWMVPAIYMGIAGLADAAEQFARRTAGQDGPSRALTGLSASGAETSSGPSAAPRRRWLTSTIAAASAIAVVALAVDMVDRSIEDTWYSRLADSNHQLNDRAAVRWLMVRRLPGDDLMSIHNGLPALWWYGHIPIGPPVNGNRLADGGLVYEAGYEQSGATCAAYPLRETLRGRHRVLLYVGWPATEDSDEFDNWVIDRLGEVGSIVDAKPFGEISRALIFELGRPTPNADVVRPSQMGRATPAAPVRRRNGCLVVRQAQRW